jgi:hypothetical protein
VPRVLVARRRAGRRGRTSERSRRDAPLHVARAARLRDEFDRGQLIREAPQWLRNYRDEVGAPDLESAVSVSAGWSVFAMRDGAVYNTYRVYPPSRLVTPLFSGLLGLLPNKE